MDDTLNRKIRNAPKADLHVHLEGTMTPDAIEKLSKDNKITLPFSGINELRAALNFKNLSDFLNLYYSGLKVLKTRDDFFYITYDYLKRAREDNVRYVELYTSPQSHIERGMSVSEMLGGIFDACDEAEARLGITAKVIYGLQRHRSPEAALAAIHATQGFEDRIVALGLGGSEKGNPPGPFREAFRHARSRGWHTTAHAGEEGPSEYIWDALTELRVERIDHGVAAESDPHLVSELARRRIPLTVCPISNVKLHVFKSMDQHNLKRLLESGCCVSIHTDDPGYFSADLSDNLIESASALSLSDKQTYQLIENGFSSAFCDDALKRVFIHQLATSWRH